MPVYDFRCKDCGRRFGITTSSIAEIEQVEPRCPACQSPHVSRLIRRVTLLTSEETRLERLADPARLAGLEDDDPRAMGRLMREMASEFGEDAGGELAEVAERLEKGESPDSIEKSLPQIGSGEE